MARTAPGDAAGPLSPSAQRILEAATSLFYERGYRGVTIDEVGTKAGFTGPAAYWHFRGKQEILASIFRLGGQLMTEAIESVTPDPIGGLRALIDFQLAQTTRRREMFGVLFREIRHLEEANAEAAAGIQRAYFASYIDYYSRLHPGIDRVEARATVMSAVAVMISTFDVDYRLGADDLEAHLRAMVCRIFDLEDWGGPARDSEDGAP